MRDEHEFTDDEGRESTEVVAPPVDDDSWASLLNFLHLSRGFDFHGYKPNTLARRIRKRMSALGLEGYGTYQDYLEVHPDEFATLFNTILINVTSFFRDPHSWDVVRTSLIPQILNSKQPADPIRAWSAGCASGEEAYTIAMLLAEAMGLEEFRARVKIYATDVDEEALNAARHASYSPGQVETVPPHLLERYFERAEGSYIFHKDLRRQIIFGRHDLMSDAPISRIDLLVCRNTLMYFNAETQAKVLSRFHFALNDGGFLFLGRAETMMTHGQTFVPVDLKRRISRKVVRGTPRERLLALVPDDDHEPTREPVSWHVYAAALEASPVAQIVVNPAGIVVLVNEHARSTFGLSNNEVGRPLQDLQISYRPIELRSVIEQAEAERQPATVKEVEWRSRMGESRWLDLHVSPLGEPAAGTVITFTDVTAYRWLQRELEQSHQELETAYEELQSTNEELETTNEELQSTVEELETTNEELQSTNEELETMNEELQSTNEELQAINDELRQRGDELNSANAFLQSVMASLRGGVAVVDRELRLLAWSRHAEELWGLRSDEVTGHHLLNLDIGLPLERIRPALRACLGGESAMQQIVLEAVNRRGKRIQCEVTCTPLLGVENDVTGAILVMEETPDGGRRSS
jgi:two-component system CheB/CheR fusion protein